MPNITGTFTHCGVGQFFSLQYDCIGDGCQDFFNFPNVTCIPSLAVSFISCFNGVTCPGPTNYTSKFVFQQPDTIVTQSYDITYGCQDILLTDDGTMGGPGGGGVQFTVKDIPSCVLTSSSSSTSTSTPLHTNTTSPAVKSPTTSGSSGSTPTTIVTVINGITTTICPSSSPSISAASTTNPASTTLVGETSAISGSSGLTLVGGQSASTAGGSTVTTPLTSASPAPSQPFVVTSGAAPRHQTKFATFYLLLISIALLIQGALALAEPPSGLLETTMISTMEESQKYTSDITGPDLRARSSLPIPSPFLENFANILTQYVNNTVEAAEPSKGLYAANIIALVEKDICGFFTTGAFTTVPLPDPLASCIETIITATAPSFTLALAPPEALLTTFSAGLLCNYIFSEFAPGVDAITSTFCN